MNSITAAVVGAVAATALLVASVNSVGPGQEPVAESDLYTYSSE